MKTVEIKWKKEKGNVSDTKQCRVLSTTYRFRGSDEHWVEDKLRRSLDAVDGVDYVFDQGCHAIKLHFAELFNPDNQKEKIIEVVREWIEKREGPVTMVEAGVTIMPRKNEMLIVDDPMVVSDHYKRVTEVMKHFNQEINTVPTEPASETKILRARLMFEEVLETIQEGLGVDVILTGIKPEDVTMNYGAVTISRDLFNKENTKVFFQVARPFDMVETVDGCYDTFVVTTGTLISCGVPDVRGQQLVDQANIDKFGGGKDEFGKFQKPPGWKPADIAGLLADLSKE